MCAVCALPTTSVPSKRISICPFLTVSGRTQWRNVEFIQCKPRSSHQPTEYASMYGHQMCRRLSSYTEPYKRCTLVVSAQALARKGVQTGTDRAAGPGDGVREGVQSRPRCGGADAALGGNADDSCHCLPVILWQLLHQLVYLPLGHQSVTNQSPINHQS